MEKNVEKSLRKDGWVVENTIPLILGMSLLPYITPTQIKENGAEVTFLDVTLYHKGDRHVLSWSKWSQRVDDRTQIEDHLGVNREGATHFNADIEAVAVGHEYVLTVNTSNSTMTFWKKYS